MEEDSFTRSSSNPHPENIMYSLLVPLTFLELSTSLDRSAMPKGSPLSLQTIGTALLTPWLSFMSAT